MKLYLDVCCLCRPLDDQRQDRIRLEAAATERIIERLQRGEWEWISSEVAYVEVSNDPNPEHRNHAKLLLADASRIVPLSESEMQRAANLEQLGFRPMDALHLACAESGGADVFLTTDDKLLRQALRQMSDLKLRVENPAKWLKEMIQ